jgi:Na+-transporting NADH:ubiquinone oxidoreductase subunit D
MTPSARAVLLDPLVRRNPITVQILGICSSLAVTTRVATALVMGLALTVTLCLSNVAISLIRHHLPRSIRLIVEITIVASLVIVVDQALQAYAYGMSKQLSVFVGLIITNCIVLGRAEAFASHHGPWPSLLDGLGNGVGYGLVLLVIAFVRELLGNGTVLGLTVLRRIEHGGWFEPVDLMQKPASAFFLLALLVWGLRAWRPEPGEEATP